MPDVTGKTLGPILRTQIDLKSYLIADESMVYIVVRKEYDPLLVPATVRERATVEIVRSRRCAAAAQLQQATSIVPLGACHACSSKDAMLALAQLRLSWRS